MYSLATGNEDNVLSLKKKSPQRNQTHGGKYRGKKKKYIRQQNSHQAD